MERASIIIQGKVQGVWFRNYVKRSAIGLDLKGWVRNNPDGTVSADVDGEKQIIMNLVELIKIGSPMSRVDNVSVKWMKAENTFNEFKIIR